MNIALWIVQGILATVFGLAGVVKSTQPIAKLGEKMPWVSRFSPAMVRIIGVVELLGALGLILPWLTGVAPILTPLSAVGIGLIQILAAVHHMKYSEKGLLINSVFLAMSIFVAYGRFMGL